MQCVLSHKHQKCSGIILLHSFVYLFLCLFYVDIFLSKENLVAFFFSFFTTLPKFLLKRNVQTAPGPRPCHSALPPSWDLDPKPHQGRSSSDIVHSLLCLSPYFFAFYKMITIWQETQTRYEEQGKHD